MGKRPKKCLQHGTPEQVSRDGIHSSPLSFCERCVCLLLCVVRVGVACEVRVYGFALQVSKNSHDNRIVLERFLHSMGDGSGDGELADAET